MLDAMRWAIVVAVPLIATAILAAGADKIPRFFAKIIMMFL